MTDHYTVPCVIDQKSFRDFAVFNSFRFRWRGVSLMLFPLFMIVLAIINRNTGSNAFFWIFLVLGFLMPAAYLFQFDRSLRNQIRVNHLEQPRVFYTVTVSPETIVVENQTERQELPWNKLYRVFRYRNYIYIYATPARVFILTCSAGEDTCNRLWEMIVQHTEKGRAQVKKG